MLNFGRPIVKCTPKIEAVAGLITLNKVLPFCKLFCKFVNYGIITVLDLLSTAVLE